MSLKSAAVSGVAWTGTSAFVTTALQFIQLAVLARLLDPRDFGLMAMVLLVTGFAHVFVDAGVSNAIIHRRTITQNQLSSLYWLNMIAGAVVFLVVVLCAPLVSVFFDEPQLRGLTVLIAFVFLLAPVGRQFQVLLQKELRFRTLGIVESVAAAVAAAIGIGCALAGLGVYSLVWANLAGTSFSALVLLGIGWRQWRPTFHFDLKELRGFLGFGFFQIGERTANYVASRIDQLLIGLILGVEVLGFYSFVFNLVTMPYTKLNPVLTRVAFPLLARLQDDTDRLRHAFMILQRTLAVINFPILFGLAATAPIFVSVVFGERWMPAVGLMQVLAFVAAFRSTGNPTGSLLLAKGRADKGFYWTLIFIVVQTPAIYAGSVLGQTMGVALALLAVQVLFYGLNYLHNVKPLIGPCFRDHAGAILPAAITSAIMGLIVVAAPLVIMLESWRLLVAQVALGMVIYFVSNILLYRKQSVQLVGLVRSRNE